MNNNHNDLVKELNREIDKVVIKFINKKNLKSVADGFPFMQDVYLNALANLILNNIKKDISKQELGTHIAAMLMDMMGDLYNGIIYNTKHRECEDG